MTVCSGTDSRLADGNRQVTYSYNIIREASNDGSRLQGFVCDKLILRRLRRRKVAKSAHLWYGAVFTRIRGIFLLIAISVHVRHAFHNLSAE